MKRLYDVSCQNDECDENGVVEERLMNYDSPPDCKICQEQMGIVITKTPSVHLKGGKSAGFYNDGFLNTGKSKAVRRINPK